MNSFRSYRTARLALFLHGSVTALILNLLLGQTYILDLYRGMNLKLPTITKCLLYLEPLFSIPGAWIALSLLWAAYLSKVGRRPSVSDQALSLPSDDTPLVETFLTSHIVLCSLSMVVGMGMTLPLYQLIGCLC